ncbi:hypothetical protein BGX34_012152 [Mortierella sp. NVP85]|nr:hypothetical protein BGX34_012152 [Mortierella sp. NVP85]
MKLLGAAVKIAQGNASKNKWIKKDDERSHPVLTKHSWMSIDVREAGTHAKPAALDDIQPR